MEYFIIIIIIIYRECSCQSWDYVITDFKPIFHVHAKYRSCTCSTSLDATAYVYYLRQGGYGFGSVGKFLCLLACLLAG